MKAGIIVLKTLTLLMAICALGACGDFEESLIGFGTFVARTALFTALTGICGCMAYRLEDKTYEK